MIRAALIAGVVLFAGTLHAQAEGRAVCSGLDGVIEQIECRLDLLEDRDSELNAVWQDVMAEHPSGGDRAAHKKEIRAAQRAWIAFRDADCAAASKVGIPKYWELNRISCVLDHTSHRIEELREVYGVD